MIIAGLQRLTLLDFPEHVACTVFTWGCNFRCRFCHNSALVLPDKIKGEDMMDIEEFFAFLDKRRGRLDGVAITGGEPLIQQDIKEFMRRIRSMGFLVKLDTNGSFPDRLREILDEGLADYVAMDIKSDLNGYGTAIGVADAPTDKILQSIRILKESGIPFEFRTTVIDELHDENTFEGIGKLIEGADRYYLQMFEDSGELIEEGRFHAPSEEKMQRLLAVARKWIPNAQIRGDK